MRVHYMLTQPRQLEEPCLKYKVLQSSSNRRDRDKEYICDTSIVDRLSAETWDTN